VSPRLLLRLHPLPTSHLSAFSSIDEDWGLQKLSLEARAKAKFGHGTFVFSVDPLANLVTPREVIAVAI
jgi:hypothetical protein